MSVFLALLAVAFEPGACLALVPRLVEPPAGYRYLRSEELSGTWGYVMEEYQRDARCVSADLNVDGTPDYATLLVKQDSRRFLVVVVLSQAGGRYAASLPIPEREISGRLEDAMLTALSPGESEGIGCAPGRGVPLAPLQLKSAAFDYLNYGVPGAGPLSKPDHWLIQWARGEFEVTNRCPK